MKLAKPAPWSCYLIATERARNFGELSATLWPAPAPNSAICASAGNPSDAWHCAECPVPECRCRTPKFTAVPAVGGHPSDAGLLLAEWTRSMMDGGALGVEPSLPVGTARVIVRAFW